MEEWVKINGYENYSISNLGNVRRDTSRTCTQKGKILKLGKNGRYLNVCLQSNGVGKTHYVHCLVAHAFIGERPKDFVINHKDGIKFNNKSFNLEYVTLKDNAQHAIKLGLINYQRGSKHWSSVLDENKVIEIRNLHQEGITQRKIAQIFGVCFQSINLIVNRKTWTHI